MIRSTFKIILRLFFKNRTHTITNILGLSVGISAVIIVSLIIRFNLSFDKYHNNPDEIYRLVQQHIDDGNIGYDCAIPFPLRLSFKEDNPQVKHFTMVDNNNPQGLVAIRKGDVIKKFEEDDRIQAYVQPEFFKIFNYDFILGDSENALNDPYTVVLSKSLANKYFSSYEEALGKVIKIDNLYDLTVTGVVNDPPLNTDIPFKMLISFSTDEENRVWDNWTASSTTVNAFVRLFPDTNISAFKTQIKNYIQDRKEKTDPTDVELALQPLANMHTDDRYANYGNRVATDSELSAIAIIGLLLLITACINFINLNTAFAFKRSREIGIKKVLGSSKARIVVQYLSETALITILSIAIALGITELLLIRIDEFIGYKLPVLPYDLELLLFLSGLFILVTVLAGLYPSFILSRYSPIAALRNKLSNNSKGLSVRRALIVVQILVSQCLIIAVIVVTKQVNHFVNQPIGIDTEAVVEFSIPHTEIDFSLLGSRIQQLNGVQSVAFSNTGTASSNTWGGTVKYNKNGEQLNSHLQVKLADSSYLETYGLKLIAGRNVIENDSVRNFLINETACKDLGIDNAEDALGMTLNIWGEDGTVIGVIADFATMSLHSRQRPIALWYAPSMHYRGAVKLAGDNWQETIKHIEDEWEVFFGDYFFNYHFLDDDIQQFYIEEKRLAKTFGILSGLAIFIGIIGLLGLISFMVNSKMKEIGIRKVLGAKVSQILVLISSDFVILSWVAFLAASPIAWYFMNSWLEGFASRIEIGFGVFIISLSVSLFFTLLTISIKSFKAATINPVEVLKDE